MARLRGRAPPGERVPGAVPHGHWRVITPLGALRSSGVAAAMTVDAPTDADVFLVFVEHCLVPALRPGDVAAMDNLGAHRVEAVGRVIRAAGAELRHLPPYSPDLNPIEPCWSKVTGFQEVHCGSSGSWFWLKAPRTAPHSRFRPRTPRWSGHWRTCPTPPGSE
jgi:transposase